jgi:hypothetical protein
MIMFCKFCTSPNNAELTAEIMIHFRGLMHLQNPGVLTFSTVSVCLDCGSTQFTIPDTELELLKEAIGNSGEAA